MTWGDWITLVVTCIVWGACAVAVLLVDHEACKRGD